MECENLNKELLKRIFGNLGFISGSNFGKYGITTSDYLIDKKLNFEGLNSKPIWCGQINSSGSNYKIAVSNLETIDNPEFIGVLNVDGLSFGFSLYEDMAAFSIKHEETWIGISLLYRLNLTAAIEMITQEGLNWAPCSNESANHMYDLMISLLALDG